MGTFGAARGSVPYAAEYVDKFGHAAFLGNIPQYSVCAAGAVDNRADIQKRPSE